MCTSSHRMPLVVLGGALAFGCASTPKTQSVNVTVMFQNCVAIDASSPGALGKTRKDVDTFERGGSPFPTRPSIDLDLDNTKASHTITVTAPGMGEVSQVVTKNEYGVYLPLIHPYRTKAGTLALSHDNDNYGREMPDWDGEYCDKLAAKASGQAEATAQADLQALPGRFHFTADCHEGHIEPFDASLAWETNVAHQQELRLYGFLPKVGIPLTLSRSGSGYTATLTGWGVVSGIFGDHRSYRLENINVYPSQIRLDMSLMDQETADRHTTAHLSCSLIGRKQ